MFVVGEQVEAVQGVQGNGLDLISLGDIRQSELRSRKEYTPNSINKPRKFKDYFIIRERNHFSSSIKIAH